MTDNIPSDQHITYQLQYRKCGKTSCSTCRNTQGHGPYWYAYWREGSRLRSGYVGKIHPSLQRSVPTRTRNRRIKPALRTEEYTPTTISASASAVAL